MSARKTCQTKTTRNGAWGFRAAPGAKSSRPKRLSACCRRKTWKTGRTNRPNHNSIGFPANSSTFRCPGCTAHRHENRSDRSDRRRKVRSCRCIDQPKETPSKNKPGYIAWLVASGANDRTRTGDLLITSELLYQLSHVGNSTFTSATTHYIRRFPSRIKNNPAPRNRPIPANVPSSPHRRRRVPLRCPLINHSTAFCGYMHFTHNTLKYRGKKCHNALNYL